MVRIGNKSTSIVNEHHSHYISMEYEDDGLLEKISTIFQLKWSLIFLLHGPWTLLGFRAGGIVSAGAIFQDETVERVDELRWR